MSDEPRALALLSSGARMLAEARTLDDLGQVRDLAVAAAQYARARDLGREAERYAVEIAALATRRIGELVPPTPAAEAGRIGARRRWDGDDGVSPGRTPIPAPRLSEARTLAAAYRSDEDLRRELARLAEPSLKRLHRLARERLAKEPPSAPPPALPATCDLRLGDFREVLADIEPGSVTLVLTDPPYASEHLQLWDDLGRLAARVLRPGGALVAYTGQAHLPEVLAVLAGHLRYWWLLALRHGHGPQQLPVKRITCGWKPLVFYVQGGRRGGRYLTDVIDGSRPRKDLHPWAQGDSEIEPLILALTEPGDLIVDPMAGSGTVAAVATRLGRRFIGAEIDPAAHARAVARIAEVRA